MAYNQFTLPRVLTDFGLGVDSPPDLFPGVPAGPVPAGYRANLAHNARLAATLNTEAARAQLLIGPLLAEVWRAGGYRVTLFVGTRFDVDEAADLTGVCDYMIGRPPQLHYLSAPVLMVAEAKNEDIPGGLGQCAAGMVAAQRFNAARGTTAPVHGAVSDGERWRFLRLAGAALDIEMGDRLVAEVDQIYGILLHICGLGPGVTPERPAAG